MVKVLLLACARGCSVDQFTNTVSLFNIVENINVPSFPGFVPEVVVVATFQREENESKHVELMMRVLNNDNEMMRHKIDVVFADERKHARQIINLPLPIVEAGQIEIRLVQSERVLSVFSMLINDPMQSVPRLESEGIAKKKTALKKAVKKVKKPSKK